VAAGGAVLVVDGDEVVLVEVVDTVVLVPGVLPEDRVVEGGAVVVADEPEGGGSL
jgi:hypothetical protein